MVDEELIYWIWLTTIKGVGPIIAKTLLEKFNTPKNIYEASEEEFISIKGIGEVTRKLILISKDLAIAKNIIEKCKNLNIKILTYEDELYPSYAKSYEKSPIVLYYKGELRNNSIGIGIVGSRRCTEYGKRVSKEAAEFLAKNNIAVVSGMAKGIDSYAHTACINLGGYTIAVIGSGIDICYPKEHSKLMEKIIETGVVITEYPPGTAPNDKNFPKRNAIISAFSKKLLIVEAGENSGAIITAEYGKIMNRDVLVVPHDIYSIEGKGCNKLIYSGASLFYEFDQLISGMNDYCINDDINKVNMHNGLEEFDDIEKQLIKIIKVKPISIDEIVYLLNLDKNVVIDTLFFLELKGVVRIKGHVAKLIV